MAITLAQYVTLPLLPLGLKSAFLAEAPATLLPSGKAWRCDTGWHHWHRSERRARECAISAIPVKKITWRQQISNVYGEATQ